MLHRAASAGAGDFGDGVDVEMAHVGTYAAQYLKLGVGDERTVGSETHIVLCIFCARPIVQKQNSLPSDDCR